ncbi:MAG: aldo/keto reductase [Oscillospiraceae bacterium]|nr:aldo/keto reductase [Oscillospiraceae bacterium]
MQYRNNKQGQPLSALGLGCMRFPHSKAETESLILAAIEGGVNFFDTAYLYPNSEKTLGAILAKHNKREKVYIGTKLPLLTCKGPQDFDRYFNEQLRRLQTDYIDYYFLHNVPDFALWEKFRDWGIEAWVAERKKAGQIRNFGFSYHGTCADFLKVIDAHAWDFCMIQYNYYDVHYQAGQAGLKAAAAKNIPVFVMEPLLGGRLATGLPKQAIDLFNKANQQLSPADWALRWLWNQSEVTLVLSGMSSTQQVQQNMRAASEFKPLSDAELAIYDDVVALFRKSYKIPCTGCNYCLPCPKGINIPACLSAYNSSYAQGFTTGISLYVNSTAALSKHPVGPYQCNGCGKCERQCPQNIAIAKALKKTAGRLEPLPLRLGLAATRKFLTR